MRVQIGGSPDGFLFEIMRIVFFVNTHCATHIQNYSERKLRDKNSKTISFVEASALRYISVLSANIVETNTSKQWTTLTVDS